MTLEGSAMTWIKVARSCETGPCPTFHVNPANGRVRVQGARVAPHEDIPDFEGMLEFEPADWENLIEQYLAARGK
jgi:hypothetical protein